MSSPITHIRPEEIDTPGKRGKYTASIIGCGQTGLLTTVLLAEAGFKVTCLDADQTVVNGILRGKNLALKSEIEGKLKTHVKAGRVNATNDVKRAVSQSDIIVITTAVRFDRKKKADYSEIENTCKKIGSNLRCGSLVIVMSLTGIGVTEGLVRETLENTSGFKVGTDFALAYSPLRTQPNQTLETAKNRQRTVAATDKNSLNVASTILQTITKKPVKKTPSVKTAEAATLFEAAQEDVKTALANELAIFCEKIGVDYLQALGLAETRFYSASSTLDFLDEATSEEPYLFLEEADNSNVKLRIPATAREVNEETIKHAASLIRDALKSCGKTLARANISLLGASQIPNDKGPFRKITIEIAEALETKGAKVRLYDPYFSENASADTKTHFKRTLTETLERADCIVILTGHDQFRRLNLAKLKLIVKMPAAIVDLEGVADPDKVEKEGFIYRGLGRGVWTR
jgi:nucleotide sugar dehydrogenase